jgi:protein TonB
MTDPVVADYENTVVNSTSLDNLPDFPRRIARFHTYIGKNFDTSEINGEKDIRIYVSLWLKRRKLTDIQVKNDPSYVLEYEAIRVLKSLKTKWIPGKINSKPVRTSTCPSYYK